MSPYGLNGLSAYSMGRPSGSSVSTATRAPDPRDPPRSTTLPYGPVGNEPFVQRITEKVRALGLHPFPLPVAVDLQSRRGQVPTLLDLRRVPLPLRWQERCRDTLHRAGACHRQRHDVDGCSGEAAGSGRNDAPDQRRRRRAPRRDPDDRRERSRAVSRVDQLAVDSVSIGRQLDGARACQQQRCGRPQLHGPQPDNDDGDQPSPEPDQVPKDLRLPQQPLPPAAAPSGVGEDAHLLPMEARARHAWTIRPPDRRSANLRRLSFRSLIWARSCARSRSRSSTTT